MTRKPTLLLIFALTLIALFGTFSTAGASGSVAAEGLVELPQVITSTESDEPEIKDIEPDEGDPGQTLDVLITGENTHFNATSEVSFSLSDGITVGIPTVDNATSMTVTITIATDAPVGKRDVTVTTVITEGVTEVVTKEDGFEVEEVEEADEPEEVEFEGAITSVTVTPGSDPITGTITVDTEDNEGEWTVHINADTRICIGPAHEEGAIADLAIGQRVKVEGILQNDGSVLARKICVRQDDSYDDDRVGFRGTIIEAKDGVTLTVQMGSYTLTVVTDENTKIKDDDDQTIEFDDLEVGQQIKGKGVLQEDGSILASEIEVEENHDGPGYGQVRFEGKITGLPDDEELMGEWTVGITTFMTVTFSVDVNTKIQPPGIGPEMGDWAKVTAVRQEDGTLLALKVHLKRHGDRPPRPVEFQGTIEAIEDPLTKIVVNVGGGDEDVLVDVLIDDLTHIEGNLQEDAHVKVRGFLQDDGSVLARRIEVEDPDDEDKVEFKGRIQSIADSMWVVGGFTVLIDGTAITGAPPQVGLLAEVKGTRVGPRTVRATEIEVEDPSDGNEQVRGIITGLPKNVDPDDYKGTWTITTEEGDSVLIEVTADTVIDTRHGEVEVGALVCVTALPQGDGTLVAQRIKVFESD